MEWHCAWCSSGWSGNGFATLSRAAAKSAAAKLRRGGLLPVRIDWTTRAAVCARCPRQVVRRGVAYCGKPLLEQVEREAEDGCGCPVNDKAKAATEHCPLDARHRPARRADGRCTCKWCDVALGTAVFA
jgi:hypothetical protein